MNKSVMKILNKANFIDCEKKILKELFNLLFIFVLTALILQKLNAQPGDMPVSEWDAFDAEEIFNEFPETDLYRNENTSLLLDSVYEFEHHELFTEHRRWFYYFNELNKIDSSYCYFSDKSGDNMNILEIRTFNTDGKLKKLILFKPDSYVPYRTNLIIEEYEYKDGNLVGKIEIRNRGENLIDTKYNYYIYNEQGNLVYDSTYYTSGTTISYYDTTYRYSWNVSDYTYDSLNRMVSWMSNSSNSPGWEFKYEYSYMIN